MELLSRAARLHADSELVELLTAAAVASEKAYPPSKNVEDQLYGSDFFERGDKSLMGQFHAVEWPDRPGYLAQLRDMRLRRLGQRIVYFERPDLLAPSVVMALDTAVRGRRFAAGGMPWRTLAKAREEFQQVPDFAAPGLAGFSSYLDGLESANGKEIR